MEQKLIDINSIQGVTLTDSSATVTYKKRNGVDLKIDAETVLIIPENPTNGDIIKALFPDAELLYQGDSYLSCLIPPDIMLEGYKTDWWNESYKRKTSRVGTESRLK